MPSAVAFLLLYCLGARASSSSTVFIAIFPRCLLWRLASISNIIIVMRRCVTKLLGFFWVSRSRPLQYLFGEYPVHQVKLNLRHPISLSLVSSTSDFTMAGLMMEGPEEVDCLSCFTLLVHSSRLMGGIIWEISGDIFQSF